jgi:DNA-binding CsgD family transcriptional regulator
LRSDANAWRDHLLKGVSDIIGARFAIYLHLHNPLQDDERLEAPLASGFLDATQMALWQHYQEEQAQKDDPYHLSFYHNLQRPLRTRVLDEVVAKREWMKSRHYNEYVRACGLEDRITSSLRLDSGPENPQQTLVFHRDTADGKFDSSARYLVKLVHHELSGLLDDKLVLPRSSLDTGSLPPRMAQVLQHMLKGRSEKQIARELDLSPFTINRHVQRIYRHFDVNSRSQLTALLNGAKRG